MSNAQWKKYDGSDEQIYEIMGSKYGFITEDNVHIECTSGCIIQDILSPGDKYLICHPHPYADMICQWARTGQPVWVKVPSGTGSHLLKSCIEFYYYNSLYSYYKTTVPNWNIPGAEYSFTPFGEEV